MTESGSAEETSVQGRFWIKRNTGRDVALARKFARRLPIFGLRAMGREVIDLADPIAGRGVLVLEFGEMTVEGEFKDGRLEQGKTRSSGSSHAVLKCPELLDGLGGLALAVMRELDRLYAHGYWRGSFEAASCNWRIARLHLGIGKRRPGQEKIDEGLDDLKAALAGAPVRDLEMRELGDDLIRRLDDIGQHGRAARIREVLGDPAQ